MSELKISITEDQHLFRKSLVSILGAVPGFVIIHESDRAEDLIEHLKAGKEAPDINVIDINLPGMSGLDLTLLLQQEYPSQKNIILTIHEQRGLINKLMRSGASAFLNKNCEIEELINAIHAVRNYNYYVSPQVLRALQSNSRPGPQQQGVKLPVELTRREEEILQLICMEYSNSEIAEKLNLSVRTVEGHRNNLLLKIGCKNTVGLVLFALKYNLFEIV